MNSKMTTNPQLPTTEPKKQEFKLSKQVEQAQNHRNGDHMEGYQQGSERGERGERYLSLIHISEPTRQYATSRMPSSA